MIATGVLGMLCGMALGLRFKAFFLAPVIVLFSIAAALAVMAELLPGAQAGVALLAGSLGLEFGYGVTLTAGLLARRSVG